MRQSARMKRWYWMLGALLASTSVQAQTLTEAVTEAVREHPVTRTELARYQQRLAEARAQKGGLSTLAQSGGAQWLWQS